MAPSPPAAAGFFTGVFTGSLFLFSFRGGVEPAFSPSIARSVDITGAALGSSFKMGASAVNGAGSFTSVAPACFFSTASKFVFHTITDWSAPPDAKNEPSGENSAHVLGPSCPFRV